MEAPGIESGWLVEAATGLDHARIIGGAQVSEDEAARALVMASRRTRGEPLQYVTGVAGFRRLEFAVGPGVFIPRPETELVAARAMERLPHGGTVVDVGTGSGAIACALADERPDAMVYATEISPQAMEWAKRNLDRLGLDVTLVACDLFSGLPDELRGAVDVIVSNPPYIAPEEGGFLPRDVVGYEPAAALFAPDGGASVIERIARKSPEWLRRGGWLVIEIGETLGRRVKLFLERAGYTDGTIVTDLAGKDRISEARL